MRRDKFGLNIRGIDEMVVYKWNQHLKENMNCYLFNENGTYLELWKYR